MCYYKLLSNIVISGTATAELGRFPIINIVPEVCGVGVVMCGTALMWPQDDCSAENHDVTEVLTVLSTVHPLQTFACWGAVAPLMRWQQKQGHAEELNTCGSANRQTAFFFFAHSVKCSVFSGNAAFHVSESVKAGSGRHHCHWIIRRFELNLGWFLVAV